MEHQSIDIILVNELGKRIDDITLEEILEYNHQRYAVLRLPDEVTFSKITIDQEGITGLEDIKDEDEFKQVEEFYHNHKI